MHNLFLGTAKHFLKALWLESGVVSQAQFDTIQIFFLYFVTEHEQAMGKYSRVSKRKDSEKVL